MRSRKIVDVEPEDRVGLNLKYFKIKISICRAICGKHYYLPDFWLVGHFVIRAVDWIPLVAVVVEVVLVGVVQLKNRGSERLGGNHWNNR